MADVWLLIRHVNYEGSTVLGVYASEKTGYDALVDEAQRPPGMPLPPQQDADSGNYEVAHHDVTLSSERWEVEG